MRSRLALLVGAALMASALPAAADVSGDVVRIGVLNDQSTIPVPDR